MFDSILTTRVVWTTLWIGLAILSVVFLVMMRTRWGQAKPLSKCIALSVFAHMLLIGYAQMTNLFLDAPPPLAGDVVQIKLFSGSDPRDVDADKDNPDVKSPKPWEQFEIEPALTPEAQHLPRVATDLAQSPLERPSGDAAKFTGGQPTAPLARDDNNTQTPEAVPPTSSTPRSPGADAAQIAVPKPKRRDVVAVTGPTENSQPNRVNDPSPSTLQRPAQTNEARDAAVKQLQELASLPRMSKAADMVASHVNRLPRSANVTTNTNLTPSQLPKASTDNTAPTAQTNAPGDTVANATPRRAGGGAVPNLYRGRVGSQRVEQARRRGSTKQSEAAVERALAWLVAQQSEDGRWDADLGGAGQEIAVSGHHRGGAGADADTGITGLALLALMARGQTHLDGKYREAIQHGLEFIIRSQQNDGCLAGDARAFAAMYCHGMASLAISEALATTGDQRLRPFVKKAVAYSLSSQHPTQGSWRYRPGDLGDMSQFGWQVMALKSAQQAGVNVPPENWQLMKRFLEAASSGQHGGLAAYRPGERVSRTMTSEALVCRIFVGANTNKPMTREAVGFITEELPRPGKPNLYYWYYGTLALHQLQDDQWRRWNDALQRELIERQHKGGHNAGSWDPDTTWGNYGGRIYSTAMATMCLEVYYRYLPLYGKDTGDRVEIARPPRYLPVR